MPGLSRWIAGGIGVSVLLNSSAVWGQVRPDRSTETVRSGNCAVQCDIQGGIESDRNLFHSFKQFSIPTNGAVYFEFSNRIRNLFVRVTGRQASTIDGLLYTDGTANVFFMNPNGILFSNNASINVGGSFTATTADAIAFDALGAFDAHNPHQGTDPALLSIDPSALLFRTVPAPITVTARGSLSSSPLQVFENNTLLLVGGDIRLENTVLSALGGGSIQVASLGEPGEIGLDTRSPLFDIEIPSTLDHADLRLRNTQIDVRSTGPGELLLWGRDIVIRSSALLAGISVDSTQQGAIAGDLVLSATDSVTIDGFSILANNVSRGSTGTSGNILITAANLSVLDGSQIDSSTLGQGNAGSVIVDVGDRVLLSGTTLEEDFASAILSNASNGALGNGGNIVIRAAELYVLNGAQLSTATDTQGNAGNIRIEATDRVVFDGYSPERRSSSIAFSNVEYFGTGNGGDIHIDTETLSLTNGASLVASTDGIGDAGRIVIHSDDTVVFEGTARVEIDGRLDRVNSGIFNRVEEFGIGDAGSIRIVADDVRIEDGARITSASLGTGNAGDVVVRARDSVLVDAAQVRTDTDLNVDGAGGDIVISTGRLTIRDNGQLAADSEGLDRAGDILINADDIQLDNGAVITATLSQDGGDITITDTDLLVLRNNALLVTSAGLDDEDGGGNGGNIAIASDLIAAVPVENSNISADAFDGNGGNVDIVTQGIFGIEFRDASTPLSDITASSEFGIDGEVTITNPSIDPTSGLVELPDDVVDASTQLRRDCEPQSAQEASSPTRNEFIITGRGGLPESPDEFGRSETLQTPWVALPSAVSEPAIAPSDVSETLSGVESSWVEAQAWAVNPQGQVVLTAPSPMDVSPPLSCSP